MKQPSTLSQHNVLLETMDPKELEPWKSGPLLPTDNRRAA